MMDNKQFSNRVSVFRESRLPETALPVGYAALIEAYDLKVPLPSKLCAIGARHKVYEGAEWRIFTPRHEPSSTLEGHLVFALKYEGLHLAVLKRLFESLEPSDLEIIIAAKPTSAYMRRVWFLYEWLLERMLELDDAKTGTYADIVDTKIQWGVRGKTSKRHRIRNNLPGSQKFCPMVRRTEKLNQFVDAKLNDRARSAIGNISTSILARTAAFLLLKDSKSSYAIEGETPPHDRIQRWGKAIGEAGKHPLDQDEFLRLQKIVLGKTRFVMLGFRKEGGFVGEHEQDTRRPLPVHISARHEDIAGLVQGMIDFDRSYSGQIDPVISAAILAFGFVYTHPFEDGNGRIHRYLIHHILAAREFNPTGIVFPVSAAILERIDDYRRVLESYSSQLLPFVKWQITEKMNVEVLNDTGDFYRYFDATLHAEFLFECVQKTIEIDLPEEAKFLERYDQFKIRVEAVEDMGASTIDLMFNFLKQNDGKFSNRARQNEFAMLSDNDAEKYEELYQEAFGLEGY
ncbi:MAG: Fic family protein [Parvibaculaceae bacterium]|nr:Fic family protein [Parvibaculaceae bacterium]